MPQQEIAFLRQKALYWPFAGYDTFGEPTYGAPCVIAVAWESKRSEQLDSKGNTIMVDSSAMTAVAIIPDSVMQLLDINCNPVGSPHDVKTANTKADIKGRAVARKIGMMRRMNLPPAAPAGPTNGIWLEPGGPDFLMVDGDGDYLVTQ